MRAMIITLDGEPAGIAGLSRDLGLLTYFTQYKESLEPYIGDIRVLRPALKVFGWAKKAIELLSEYKLLPIIPLSRLMMRELAKHKMVQQLVEDQV